MVEGTTNSVGSERGAELTPGSRESETPCGPSPLPPALRALVYSKASLANEDNHAGLLWPMEVMELKQPQNLQ